MGVARKDRAKQVRILIVDDHPLVRESLQQLLEMQPGFVVCGEAESRQQATAAVNRSHPDLVILDLSLRDSSGLDVIKDLSVSHSKLPVLVLSMHDEALHAERVLRAGARGYINKQEATEKIVDAIRTVIAGGIYLSQSQISSFTSMLAARPRARTGFAIDSLTPRELSVFRMLGEGFSTRQIASRLKLHIRTVETYRARIKEKLQLDRGHELLLHAHRWVQSGTLPGSHS